MSKHTPGPWEHSPKKKFVSVNGKARVANDKGWFIGQPSGLDIGEVYLTASQNKPEQEANARLIAAAPDLLASCEELYNALREYTDGCETEVQDEILKRAESVLGPLLDE